MWVLTNFNYLFDLVGNSSLGTNLSILQVVEPDVHFGLLDFQEKKIEMIWERIRKFMNIMFSCPLSSKEIDYSSVSIYFKGG